MGSGRRALQAGAAPCTLKLKKTKLVVTQWRASEQLCSSTIVTNDATNNIQVSTRPPAPITRQPPHLDENIRNQNLLDRLLEYIRLPREMFWKTSFELLTVLLLVAATRHFVSADCLWEEKGLMVATGEITGFDLAKKKVEICTKKGELKFRKENRVKKPLKIACDGCRWKGEVICDKEVVQDLYIWWFETHCSKGKLHVVGRSWGEVVADPRFKP